MQLSRGISSLHGFLLKTAVVSIIFSACDLQAEMGDRLPSWNEGPAKAAIIDFVRETTSRESPNFVPGEERIATFDQDGTLWVEHPIYTQVEYCLTRLALLAKTDPELADREPFKSALHATPEAVAQLSLADFKEIAIATLTGISVEELQREVGNWITVAKDPRWDRLYTELIYQPMVEVLDYLRDNGYKTYIATGGGQDFVRVYAQQTYGIPVEQVIGTATGVTFGYMEDGEPFLTKDPTLLLNDNDAGKPEGIHLMIGRRPRAAFGNSVGDRQMLEYTYSGPGKRLAMLVLHDDPQREYAYGPAEGLPDTTVGAFTQELYDEAEQQSWVVVSMKDDWKRIFSFN